MYSTVCVLPSRQTGCVRLLSGCLGSLAKGGEDVEATGGGGRASVSCWWSPFPHAMSWRRLLSPEEFYLHLARGRDVFLVELLSGRR